MNYISNDLINNANINEIDERNTIMTEEIKNIKKYIGINFLTKSLYENQIKEK